MVRIPPGLLAYFTDSKTKAAVDLLLAKKRPSIPDDVKWSEVSEFFRALRAARQIQVDYAILLDEIWNAVWKPLPGPWKARAPNEQAGDGSLDPATIWIQNYALRQYEREKLTCELIVFVDKETSVQLGFNLFHDSKPLLSKTMPGWEYDEGTLWGPPAIVNIQKNLNLAPLTAVVAEAMKILRNTAKP